MNLSPFRTMKQSTSDLGADPGRRLVTDNVTPPDPENRPLPTFFLRGPLQPVANAALQPVACKERAITEAARGSSKTGSAGRPNAIGRSCVRERVAQGREGGL